MSNTVHIDPDDPTPPYEQLRRQLSGLIISGHLTEGDRLAPVRQLAADLGLATGTVARAYRELEASGLVQGRRGGGTTVLATPKPSSGAVRSAQLKSLAGGYISSARLLGATDEQITAALTATLAV